VLLEIKEKAGEIEAQWSGEENGIKEENAHISHEIIEKINEILDLIGTLN
jgi:predicted DNA-binding ArsR family transcriptional regulator